METRISITSIEIETGSLDTKETEASIEETPRTACDIDAFVVSLV